MLRLPVQLYKIGLGDPLNLLRIMVITTRGRKSGQPRHTALEYRRHGSKIYVVSAWSSDAQWYKNLLDYPYATMRMGRKRVRVTATTVNDSGEALRVLNLFHRTAPFIFDPVVASTAQSQPITPLNIPDIAHRITIVRFDPTHEAQDLPYLEASYGWALAAGTIVALSAVVILLAVSLSRATKQPR